MRGGGHADEAYSTWARALFDAARDAAGREANLRSDGTWRALGALSPAVLRRLADLARRGGPDLPRAPPGACLVAITAAGLRHLTRVEKPLDTRGGLALRLSRAECVALPRAVAAPCAVYWDREARSVLLAFPGRAGPARPAKLAIRLDQADKALGRDPATGRARRLHLVVGGGHEDASALAGRRFLRLDGETDGEGAPDPS